MTNCATLFGFFAVHPPLSADSEPAIAWQFVWTLGVFVAVGMAIVTIGRLLAKKPATTPRPDTSDADGAMPLLLGTEAPSICEAAVIRTPMWQRLGTLLVLALLVFVPAYLGPLYWVAAIAILALVGLSEVWRLMTALGLAPQRFIGSLAGLLVVGSVALAQGPELLSGALTAGLLGIALTTLFTPSEVPLASRLGATLFGVLYVGLLGAYLALIGMQGGFGAVVFFMMVVQMADVGGLVAGVLFGRHPLAPSLSPNKTWEGTAGSFALAGLSAWAFAFAMPGVGLGWLLAIAVILAAAGLVGDLLASGLKRGAGLKDFGYILPGHGGVLDRFDGYLYAAPVFWAAITALSLLAA